MDTAKYSESETLRDGSRITIRSLRHHDRDDFIAAAKRASSESIYRRFFAPRQEFSDAEVSFFVDVDFIKHVALIAVDENGEQPEIVGGGRYVVGAAGQAELAFMVIDQYQGKGIGQALLCHLIAIAKKNGVRELIADVLADNMAMLKVFERSGFHAISSRERGTKCLALDVL